MVFTISFYLALIIHVFTPERVIATQARDFMVDELGNIYFVQNTFLEKHSAVGNTVFRTSELNYGNISYIDVTNPLKPFLYFRENNSVLILDNTLSQQGDAINLFESGFEQVELVAGSRGDAYWLWDSRNSELIRVDRNFKKLSSTGNLSVLLSREIHPSQLLERGNHLYMRDTLNGVFVFDVYGNYRTILNIRAQNDIQVINNTLMYHTNDKIILASNDWISEEVILLPDTMSGRKVLFDHHLYALRDSTLQVWKMEESSTPGGGGK